MSLSLLSPLLKDYSESRTQFDKETVEKEIWSKFGKNGAVLILDMSGFSRTTVSKGLVYYLAMVQRMQTAVHPILSKDGCIVKYEADNAYAFFNTTEDAIKCALKINEVLHLENRKKISEDDIRVSIGIDYGEFLHLQEAGEFFGNPVNFACKLGEDIGEAGDILVTEAAWSTMTNHNYEATAGAYQISGIAFKAFKIKY